MVCYKPGNAEEFMPFIMAPTEAIAARTPCRAVGRNGFVVPPEKLVYLTRTEADAVERNLRRMLRVARRYEYWKKTVNVPANPTEEQRRQHEACQRCEMCEVKFVKGCKKKGKVMHHRRGTGDYISSICFQCNRTIRQPRQVPVFFHNGGGYDFKFLLRAIACAMSPSARTRTRVRPSSRTRARTRSPTACPK